MRKKIKVRHKGVTVEILRVKCVKQGVTYQAGFGHYFKQEGQAPNSL